jgi:hypothetical protein
MGDDDRSADTPLADAVANLGRRLDTVAGAVASIAESHRELGSHLAETEARRTQDARDVARRLDGLEQALLAVPIASMAPLGSYDDKAPSLDLDDLRADVALSLEVLVRVAEVVERMERDDTGRVDVAGPLAAASDELGARLTLHTDAALAGAVRLIDGRLATLRSELQESVASVTSVAVPAQPAGFEAGAVMGAAQAAWNRLEQRLDTEFDDLSRQLAGMADLVQAAVASAEAVANRPVVTGEQLLKAASSVKTSVIGAGRARWERRGRPRGLGSGS